jgi:hypothetical protein
LAGPCRSRSVEALAACGTTFHHPTQTPLRKA